MLISGFSFWTFFCFFCILGASCLTSPGHRWTSNLKIPGSSALAQLRRHWSVVFPGMLISTFGLQLPTFLREFFLGRVGKGGFLSLKSFASCLCRAIPATVKYFAGYSACAAAVAPPAPAAAPAVLGKRCKWYVDLAKKVFLSNRPHITAFHLSISVKLILQQTYIILYRCLPLLTLQ